MPRTYFRFERHASAASSRSPALERLLACADGDHGTVADWRAEAQQLVCGPRTEPLAAAPAAFFAQVGPPAEAGAVHVLLAAPLHTRASMTSVSLPHRGVLTLTSGEARELAADFNSRLPSGGAVRLFAGGAGDLFCAFDAPMSVDTRDPDLLQGHDLWDFQPTGPDAGRLKKLGSELEMFLYDHPVNRRRIERGELEITALWLWGGGPVPERLPPMSFGFTGTDLLFGSWALRAAEPAPAPGGAAAGRIIRCPAAPGEPAFESFATALLAESAEALRRGRVDALYLSAGARRFCVRRMRRWFFRRTRPWWEYFDETEDVIDDGADR